MLAFLVLFALAVPFPTLYVLAILEITQNKSDQSQTLDPRVTATPRRLSRILGQRSPSQNWERMEFAEPNVSASFAEFQAVILAGYGNA